MNWYSDYISNLRNCGMRPTAIWLWNREEIKTKFDLINDLKPTIISDMMFCFGISFTLLCSALLYYALFYSTVLYRAYSTVFYSALLYCTLLCFTVLCFTLLCFTLLYSTMLSFTLVFGSGYFLWGTFPLQNQHPLVAMGSFSVWWNPIKKQACTAGHRQAGISEYFSAFFGGV